MPCGGWNSSSESKRMRLSDTFRSKCVQLVGTFRISEEDEIPQSKIRRLLRVFLYFQFVLGIMLDFSIVMSRRSFCSNSQYQSVSIPHTITICQLTSHDSSSPIPISSTKKEETRGPHKHSTTNAKTSAPQQNSTHRESNKLAR